MLMERPLWLPLRMGVGVEGGDDGGVSKGGTHNRRILYVQSEKGDISDRNLLMGVYLRGGKVMLLLEERDCCL